MSNDILLFGGTFDPVHNGHVRVARALADVRGFDRVVFVPTATPPHKPVAVASASDRAAMLQLVCADDALFDVNEVELNRAGRSYTYDTVRALQAEYGDSTRLHWLIGADMLAELHKWYRAAELMELAEFVIARRPPWDTKMDEVFTTLAEHFPQDVVERLRAAIVDTPLVDVSSTDIRLRVAVGESIDELVPGPVAGYIDANGLYR